MTETVNHTSRLTVHTADSAPPRSRPLLEGIAADLGFVPNLAASTADSPALLSGFDGLRRAAAATALDPVDREIAGLAVGVAVGNAYGVAFHSTVLGSLGAAVHDIDAMRRGAEPSDPRHAAVYAFAREFALARGAVDDAAITRVTGGGVTAELLDIVAECAFAATVGMIDNLSGRVPLDPPLRPMAWSGAPEADPDN